jgi:hypothetical protein
MRNESTFRGVWAGGLLLPGADEGDYISELQLALTDGSPF